MFWLSIVLALLLAGSMLLGLRWLRKRNPGDNRKGIYTRMRFSGRFARARKAGAVVLVGVVMVMMVAGCFNLATRIAYIRPVAGQATWITTNSQQYLSIEADDHYSLGYLEGKHLAYQIVFTNLAAALMLVRDGVDYRQHATEYLPYIPDEYITMMQGIADGASHGSGMPVSFFDVLVQNCFLDIQRGILGPRVAAASSMGCTSFAAVNDDNSTMFGQNYDLSPASRHGLSWVLYQVPGRVALFSLRMGAMIIPITRNAHGVTSLATIVTGSMEANATTPTSILARMTGETARNASQALDIVLEKGIFSASYTFIIADDVSVNAFEVLPTGARPVPANPVALSNRFWSPDWNEDHFTRRNYSLGRQMRAMHELGLAFSDDMLTHDEILSILSLDEPHPDFNDSAICRTTGGSQTLAFLTKHGFGLGTPLDGVGENPF